MLDDLDWKQPAVVGGLIVGVFSAVPGVSALNCCFCAWALIGGWVAISMTSNRSPRVPRSGEAAQIGVGAGAVAAVTFILLAIPIVWSGVATDASLKMLDSIFGNVSNPELQSVFSEAMDQARDQTPGERLLTSLPVLLIQAILYLGFTVLGALLCSSVKGRKTPPSAPPGWQGPPLYQPPTAQGEIDRGQRLPGSWPELPAEPADEGGPGRGAPPSSPW
jgi:hypothetical protein